MAKRLIYLIITYYLAIMGLQSCAITDVLQVEALQDLYMSLNRPKQLELWTPEGGDPCDELWKGVECFGSSIINLKLHGMGLTGVLGFQLSNLKHLKHLDLSSNNIAGSIPCNLPPNVTYLDLAGNTFSDSIPYSIETMKHIRHLNLSHNLLYGPLGDVFDGLENLKEMDLSFNRFTGDLPLSFKSLASLTRLNIEDNHFSGIIPENFHNIPNLRFGGNKFVSVTNYPPWKFPTDSMPTEQSINSLPAKNSSAFASHPSQIIGVRSKKRSNAFGIDLMISVITLVAACAAIAIFIHRQRSHGNALEA